MSDKEFLKWLHDRLELVCGENRDVDFMHKLRAIANATPPDRETANRASSMILAREDATVLLVTLGMFARPPIVTLTFAMDDMVTLVDQKKIDAVSLRDAALSICCAAKESPNLKTIYVEGNGIGSELSGEVNYLLHGRIAVHDAKVVEADARSLVKKAPDRDLLIEAIERKNATKCSNRAALEVMP